MISAKKEEMIVSMTQIIEQLEEQEVDEFMRVIDKIGIIINNLK